MGVPSVAMSAARFSVSVRTTVSIDWGSISGSSPCTFTRMSARGTRRATSAIRSVPLGCSPAISHRAPKPRAVSAISTLSVAMITSESDAARQAASQVC